MTATAVAAAPTVTLPIPVTLIPGPHGTDSPAVVDLIPRFRWYAWIDLADQRATGQPSTLSGIEWALGHAVEHDWPLWWRQPTPAGDVVHVAQAATVEHGGRMLLTACMRSRPWTAEDPDVVTRTGTNPPGHYRRCPMCTAVALPKAVVHRMYVGAHDSRLHPTG